LKALFLKVYNFFRPVKAFDFINAFLSIVNALTDVIFLGYLVVSLASKVLLPYFADSFSSSSSSA